MKSLSLFISFLFFFTISLKGQEQNNVTYRIVDNGSVKDVQPYINALNSANMQNHRLRTKRNIISFESGVKAELFSAQELQRAGRTIDPAAYPESFEITRQEPVFSLGQNNFIMEMHHPENKFSK